MRERLEQLIRFHEADPGDTFATYGIAMEHLKLGQRADALAWLDKTIALDPDYAYAYYQKAAVLIECGQMQDAAAAIEAGLAAARRSGDAHAADELLALRDALG